jgi:hypothetical protein
MGWIFPLKLGKARRRFYQLKRALLEELKKYGLAVEPGDTAHIEASADARAIAWIWSINQRVANQNHPRRMLENLPVWEEAMQLRPTPTQSDNDRRRVVGARMRGFTNNALDPDMKAAATEVAGSVFVETRTTVEADATIYWPGVNPGPPGFENTSNRSHVAFVLDATGVEQDDFITRRDAVVGIIADMRPDWLTYEVGTDPDAGFVIGQSIVGQSLLT